MNPFIMTTNTATITFHASHNYGSVLQAYALQQTIKSLGHDNVIINLRTMRQKDLYTVFTRRGGIKYAVKNLSHLLWYFPLKKRYDRFETFINNSLSLTEEYSTEEELADAFLNYDVFIAGSDQIWNPVPADFDWSYYLTFVSKGKKISYAPSFGQLASQGDMDTRERIANALKSFDAISVREQRGADNVKALTGETPPIVLDPTLLLKKEDWLGLVKDRERIIKGDYIFFYTLFADPGRMDIIKRVSKATGLPVVTSNFSNQYDVFNPFIKRYDAGPLDFLTLIRDAKLVVASSFHGTVFSILLNVPFFAIDGMTDARISTLLRTTGLEGRGITSANVEEQCKNAFPVDFTTANGKIDEARKTSVEFLKKSLEV